jgi:hypothetical protein
MVYSVRYQCLGRFGHPNQFEIEPGYRMLMGIHFAAGNRVSLDGVPVVKAEH